MIEEPDYINKLPPIYKEAYHDFKYLYFQGKSFTNKRRTFKTYSQEFTLLPHIIQAHLTNIKPMGTILSGYVNPVLCHVTRKIDCNIKQKDIDFIIRSIPQHLYFEEIYDFILMNDEIENDVAKLQNLNGFHFPILKKLLEISDATYLSLDKNDLVNERMRKLEKFLTFPHQYLSEAMELYNEKTTKFVSPTLTRNFKENCDLHNQLLKADNDDIKWQDLIFQTNNEKFIIYSYNCRIGRNLLNVNLWKMLMEYLYARKNYSQLFVTFSRYCRFFVEDLEIRHIYFNQLIEATRNGKNVETFWKDLIEIEKKFATKESYEILLKIVMELINLDKLFPKDKCDCCNIVPKFEAIEASVDPKSSPQKKNQKMAVIFYKNKIQQQSTCFPFFMVSHILQNAPFPVLQRLYQSAKYFFIKHPKLLCANLKVYEGFGNTQLKYTNNSALLKLSNNPIIDFSYNFCVCKSFYYSKSPATHAIAQNENTIAISALIQSVNIWKLSYITIIKTYLKFGDLKILLKESNILKANFSSSKILEGITIPEFLDLFPNAFVLILPNGLKYCFNTNHVLQTTMRNTKLKEFSINCQTEMMQDINPHAFRDFIINNAAPNSKFSINVDRTRLNTYKSIMENLTKFWTPKNETPVIEVSARYGI